MEGIRPCALAATALAALGLAACGGGAVGGDEEEGGDLKVALITDSSGATALFGQANIDGVRMAIDELNGAGGVDGRKVKLVVRDSKATPETGVTLTRNAILRDKVDAVFGPVSSGVALAMTDVAKQYKTPIFFHTSNSEGLTGKSFHRYAFSVVPSTIMEGRGNAIELAKTPYKRWAVIAPDYEFGHVQSESFVDKLRELNADAQIVKKVFPELGEKDFTSFINSLQGARPDAVYSALFAGDLIAFTNQAAPVGIFKDTFFTSLYETDALKALKGKAPVGERGYSRAPFFAIDTPQANEFVKKYRERNGEYPSDWAIMAYDAVKLWAQGVEKGGSEDGDKVVDALEGARFESLRGAVTIRKADHQASVPVYSGTIAADPKVGFPTWDDVSSVPGEKVWPSEAEVRKLQGD